MIGEEDICRYLQQTLEEGDWRLDHPQQGFTIGQRFIATSARHKVFIKLGNDHRIIQHLAEVGLTPRYLAGGTLAGTSIAVQEFVEGIHPGPQWYVENKRTIAYLLKTLHNQTILRAYIPAVEDESYHSLYARYIQNTKEEYRDLAAIIDQKQRQTIEMLLEGYEQHLPLIEGEGLEPSHCDPNPGNVLVTTTTAYLIDWDQLHLSDPLRDIAQVLWWQYPLSEWEELLDLFNIDLTNAQQRERFYCTISIWSLQVALFFMQTPHQQYVSEFLLDAQHALKQEPANRTGKQMEGPDGSGNYVVEK